MDVDHRIPLNLQVLEFIKLQTLQVMVIRKIKTRKIYLQNKVCVKINTNIYIVVIYIYGKFSCS